jgi:hypothetical protein
MLRIQVVPRNDESVYHILRQKIDNEAKTFYWADKKKLRLKRSTGGMVPRRDCGNQYTSSPKSHGQKRSQEEIANGCDACLHRLSARKRRHPGGSDMDLHLSGRVSSTSEDSERNQVHDTQRPPQLDASVITAPAERHVRSIQ